MDTAMASWWLAKDSDIASDDKHDIAPPKNPVSEIDDRKKWILIFKSSNDVLGVVHEDPPVQKIEHKYGSQILVPVQNYADFLKYAPESSSQSVLTSIADDQSAQTQLAMVHMSLLPSGPPSETVNMMVLNRKDRKQHPVIVIIIRDVELESEMGKVAGDEYNMQRKEEVEVDVNGETMKNNKGLYEDEEKEGEKKMLWVVAEWKLSGRSVQKNIRVRWLDKITR